MHKNVPIDVLKKSDLNVDGDIHVDDTDGVRRTIIESQFIVPASGRNAPAHEPTDLIIVGSYLEAHKKLLEFGFKPIGSPVCLGCGAANDHPNTPDDRYCFECVKRGETPCRSPGCENDGYRDEKNGVTRNYCRGCDAKSKV